MCAPEAASGLSALAHEPRRYQYEAKPNTSRPVDQPHRDPEGRERPVGVDEAHDQVGGHVEAHERHGADDRREEGRRDVARQERHGGDHAEGDQGERDEPRERRTEDEQAGRHGRHEQDRGDEPAASWCGRAMRAWAGSDHGPRRAVNVT